MGTQAHADFPLDIHKLQVGIHVRFCVADPARLILPCLRRGRAEERPAIQGDID